MGFKCPYCTFGFVGVVEVGWYQLVADISSVELLFEEVGALIVEDVQLWFESSFLKVCGKLLVCFYQFLL